MKGLLIFVVVLGSIGKPSFKSEQLAYPRVAAEGIEELYVLAVEARNNGQHQIPVYIFPTRLDEKGMHDLRMQSEAPAQTLSFWNELEPLYHYFETQRKLPSVRIDDRGHYVVN